MRVSSSILAPSTSTSHRKRSALAGTGPGTGKAKQEYVYSFRPYSLNVELALGHRHNAWYLLFARHYRILDSREVTRLDKPDLGVYISDCTKETGQTVGGVTAPEFWFDPKAFCGWERPGQTFLDFLLGLNPAILRTTWNDPDLDDGLKLVQVLIPEAQLAHWCEGCGTWESVPAKSRDGKREDADSEQVRWIRMTRHDLPEYLCPRVGVDRLCPYQPHGCLPVLLQRLAAPSIPSLRSQFLHITSTSVPLPLNSIRVLISGTAALSHPSGLPAPRYGIVGW